MIESYGFGRIVINGKSYSSDIIIVGEKVKADWWRKEGHRLHIEDLKEIVNKDIDFLVVGTGYFGLMKVPDEVKRFLAEKGIEVIVQKTAEACKTFNKLMNSKKKVAAALHLTC
ncbi:hypothetical protein DRO54_00805 [Candidatus Bathyarchaeota archaeon]|nr:MAG: hypothetical protein DRO54_00805 [Candidatus Bathyarchaeota archaeon]